jgi:hypothetical protein
MKRRNSVAKAAQHVHPSLGTLTMLKRLLLAATASLTIGLAPAAAQSPIDILKDGIAGSGFANALKNIEAAADQQDATVAAALGMLRFTRGVEKFAQAMYRHGLRPGARSAAPLVGMQLPVGNPNPEPMSYQQFRGYLSDFAADLAAADEALTRVGEREVKLPVDLRLIRIDIDGDGVAGPSEQLFALANSTQIVPQAPDVPFLVAFDTADIHWLRGYSNLLGAVADFWLAHDFEGTFNGSFQTLFPSNAPTPEAKKLAQGAGTTSGFDVRDLADTVAMIHLINWQAVEPQRLNSFREKLLNVAKLNRITWRLARAETDDDHEWLPNPRQTSFALRGMLTVTDERIDAWLGAVAEIEDVLEGRKLMPHWRFSPSETGLPINEPDGSVTLPKLMGEGVNIKKMLTEPRGFDLVLWFTGHAAVPYLEQGEVARFNAWGQAERIFGGDLVTYAFWFN